jgi:hypothetical protein
MACRSEPAPESLVFVTVKVANVGAALAATKCFCCHSARPSDKLKVIPIKVSFFMQGFLSFMRDSFRRLRGRASIKRRCECSQLIRGILAGKSVHGWKKYPPGDSHGVITGMEPLR